MYSPKIAPAMIPRLYRLAQVLDIPMTRLVNQLLEQGITHLEHGAEHVNDPPAPSFQKPAHTPGRRRKRRGHTDRERA